MFDTLKFARALRDGGQFTSEQAERLSDALSEAIAGEVVSRADLGATESELGRKNDELRAEVVGVETRLERKIEEVRAEVVGVETRLERKIEEVRTEVVAVETRLERKIADLRTELKQNIADVRQEIADLRTEVRGDIRGLEARIEAAKADTIKWIVGIIGFQSVAIIGAAIVLARLLAH